MALQRALTDVQAVHLYDQLVDPAHQLVHALGQQQLAVEQC